MPIDTIDTSKKGSSGGNAYTLDAASFLLDEWPLDSEALTAMQAMGATAGDKAEYITTKSISGDSVFEVRYVFSLLTNDVVYRAPMPKPEYTTALGVGDVREGAVWAQIESGELISYKAELVNGSLAITQYSPLGDTVIAPSIYFGNPVAAPDNIANGPMIDPVSFRFRASQSAKIEEYYMWWRSDNAGGYSGGDGGTYTVEIQADVGGKPSGVTLGVASTYTHDFVSAPLGNVYLNNLDGPVTVKGNVYHLVVTNIDATPSANFVSFNGVHYTSTSQDQVTARPAETDLRTLYFHSLGGATQDWIDYPESASPVVAFMPLVAVVYDNGTQDGEDNQYGHYVTTKPVISGVSRCRSVMSFSESGETSVFRFFAKQNTGSDQLTVTINGVSQTVSGLTSDFAWHEVAYSGGIMTGQDYTVEFTCPATSEFEISGTRRINPGWKPTRLYSAPAESSVDDGVTWAYTGADTNNVFSMYFT